MKIADYKGFEIHLPTTGGKAGRGCNRTSSIQVRKGCSIKKQFRFILDGANQTYAVQKAKNYCEENQ